MLFRSLAALTGDAQWVAAPVAAGTLTFTLGNETPSELTLKAGYWDLTINEEDAVKVKAGGAPESGLTGLDAANGAWYFVAATPAEGEIDLTKVEFKALAKKTGAETLMVPNFEMPAGNTTVKTGYFKVVKITVANETTTETLYLAKDANVEIAQGNKAIVDNGTTQTVTDASSNKAEVAVTKDLTITIAPADQIVTVKVDNANVIIVGDADGKVN